MPATSNELFRDALVRRQIYLSKFSDGLAADIIGLLDDTEKDLRLTLLDRLGEIEGRNFSARTTSRLNALEKSIAKLRADAFDGAAEMWDTHMQELAAAEAEFLDSALIDVLPVEVDTVMPDPVKLAGIVSVQPMQGKILADWASKMQEADLERIMSRIRVGMAQGNTTDEIVQKVIGTRALDGRDGATEVARRDAASITQTAIATVAGETRQEYYAANSDIIGEELYVATLDDRTTEECAALDGETFPIGEGPQPPIHWNCRSTRVPVIDGEVLGERPAVSATDAELDGLDPEARANRVAEMVGTVPATTTYSEFLGNQTEAFQESVLGVTRAQLFRDGELPLNRFVNSTGHTYTLDQLRAREPEAFRRAGL